MKPAKRSAARKTAKPLADDWRRNSKTPAERLEPEKPWKVPFPVPVRLLNKAEVVGVVGVSYPTIWKQMCDGKFPRPRSLGGVSSKSYWRSDEIEAWIDALPRRKLKGDTPPEAA